jgi:hypothetical protein
MSREKQIDEMAKLICTFPQCINYNIIGGCKASECNIADKAEALYNAGYLKQSEDEIFEAVDMFRNLLTNKFIELCNYNDYGKINLLLIGETIDRIYDDVVAKMKGGAE